ncbi:MAG: FCD domain-containing protein [Sneathiellales bacterium]|nr:FCD domain-containing protein [Sneathiellales bacterium]
MPGDRLPQEHELIDRLQVSKGTTREALKIMETQGLIRTRTGPGGGAFVSEMSSDTAYSLLATHFFFQEISIEDIYALRITLEPMLAAAVCVSITDDQIDLLREKMTYYAYPPASIEEEQSQREKELEFHELLADFCDNALLKFNCRFLIKMLKELTVCKKIYKKSNPELRERGLSYQEQLLSAFERKSPEDAETILCEHMKEARELMLAQEAHIKKGFLKA